MTESTKLFLFPDINVWVALTYDRHVHHRAARQWFDSLAPMARLFFCRLTQLGLLRLLSSEAVMGPDLARGQQEAWNAYDTWLQDERIEFLEEPGGLEAQFRALTRSHLASPKEWADSYLFAFASAADLRLATFDRALRHKGANILLLQ
ncbi:MAG: TA system VapC family ribonuclease toxin [Candidatus Acidiferrum sp.]